MERVYSQSGDRIETALPVAVRRYGPFTRANHWLTAACLILLLISGLGFFHPSLYFLTGLFGGGQTARLLHPWIGVVLFVSFFGLFLPDGAAEPAEAARTRVWLANAKDVVTGHEENLPELGKYNAGQKLVFWAMTVLIVRPDRHRRDDVGAVFRRARVDPGPADRHHRAFDRRRADHLHLDPARLCRRSGPAARSAR